ncbi:MAG: hypothetical protein S4CHLAM20_04030 [Chlamydiia bacterium]|nr:hypothetical protein [Chlamydiia bacterium]
MSYNSQIEKILTSSPPFISDLKPSEWSEQKRIMTSDVSAFPGRFSYDRTPYLREPVDCLSPEHPSRVIAVMKGAQIGFSTGVIENGIGWIIANNPGNILLAARDESLVKKMMDTKIDQMIDSCGIRELIRPNVIRKKNQRTGDTSMSKEFPGGNLSAFSIQKPGRMRQISAKYGFLDDFEAAPVDKDAGDASALFETRFASYFSKMKLFYISTPEVKQTSNIEPIYDRGDARKYHVPCPCCGDMIEWKWNAKTPDNKHAGITWALDGSGRVIDSSVGYTCQSCGDFFDERKKYEMLLAGEWKPTKDPEEEGFYSYHISALYSPPGMYDWTHYAKKFIEACPPNMSVNIDKYKTFLNTVLGETWEAQGEKPTSKGISLNTRDYKVGVVPAQKSIEDGNGSIVMLTCGSDMNGKEDDARLDYEIVAWSESGASYSIEHGSIGTFIPRENTLKVKKDRERWSYHHGAKNSVWPKFQDIINREFITDDGDIMKLTVTGLDTGYFTLLAYDFLNSCSGLVLGLKGKDTDKFRGLNADTPTFKPARERNDLFLVEVNQIKDILSDSMKLRWDDGDGSQPPSFMNFPEPSDGLYNNKNFFHHFESEHRIVDSKAKGTSGMKWVKVKTTAQNHMWDCRVYNIVLKDILTYMLCKESKQKISWGNYCELIK